MRKRDKRKRVSRRLKTRSSKKNMKRSARYSKKRARKSARYRKKKAKKLRYSKKSKKKPGYSKKRLKRAAKRAKKRAKKRKRVSKPRKLPRDVARKYLRNVSPEKSFWISDGPIIKNLGELLRELKTMSPQAFTYHVNKKRNDFSKWINEVIGDRTLAKSIRKARTRTALYNKVKTRVKMMRRVIGG